VGDLVLGNYAGAQGDYSLSGGMLDSARVEVGRSGAGTFDHTGGNHIVSESLLIGSTGHYRLGGWGSLQVAGVDGAVNSRQLRADGRQCSRARCTTMAASSYNAAGNAGHPPSAGHLVNHGSVDARQQRHLRRRAAQRESSLDLLPTGRTLTLNGQGLDQQRQLRARRWHAAGQRGHRQRGRHAGHGRIGGWEIDNFGTLRAAPAARWRWRPVPVQSSTTAAGTWRPGAN
jgi:hypothetical protein